MTALRRMVVKMLGGATATLVLALGAPGQAQENAAPVDVTAAPPPSAETIGPAQLRDFNLQGTVTRPSDQPAATPANTASARPRSGEAVPAEAAAAPVAVETDTRTATPRVRADAPAGTQVTSSGRSSGPGPVTPSLPLEVTTNPAPQPDYQGGDPTAPASLAPDEGMFSWPWLAALIALAGGGAFLAWSRVRRQREGDPGRMAFAGPVLDVVPEAQPAPPLRPRPDPTPPRAQPPAAPAPRADPVPVVKPSPKHADDGLIVSTRLKPQLNVEFQPDRMVITEQEAVLQFDMVITNLGSAPARDVLVEGRLFSAHAGQDREIGAFFENPKSEGDRIASVAPLARISLKSLVRLPLDQLHQFEAAGRRLFVPLVGFNIQYRFGSGSGDGHAAASFLVGRGKEGDEKLAPFRLDLGPRIFRDLRSRMHSLGLQPVG